MTLEHEWATIRALVKDLRNNDYIETVYDMSGYRIIIISKPVRYKKSQNKYNIETQNVNSLAIGFSKTAASMQIA